MSSSPPELPNEKKNWNFNKFFAFENKKKEETKEKENRLDESAQCWKPLSFYGIVLMLSNKNISIFPSNFNIY